MKNALFDVDEKNVLNKNKIFCKIVRNLNGQNYKLVDKYFFFKNKGHLNKPNLT
jgi:hypothetical protein